MNLYALHGFLGAVSDWDFVAGALPECIVHKVDLWKDADKSLNQWALSFNSAVEPIPGKRLCIGYSMGARLGLHAVCSRPDLWDGAVFISGHPGLESSDLKQDRLESDRKWAAKVLADPWPQLLTDWEGQAVFQGTGNTFVRIEADFSREALSQALLNWSLGMQDCFLATIKELTIPILWIAGAKDEKFLQLAQRVVLSHPKSKVMIASDAGHRVPWQIPEKFIDALRAFIFTIEETL